MEIKVPMEAVEEMMVQEVSTTPTGNNMVDTMATMKNQDLELLRLKQRIR